MPVEHLPGIPIPLASLEDLMCMKLAAIAGRGAARDFWDFYEILAQAKITLAAALGTFAQKYASHDIGHLVKSLVYFADADAAPPPEGLAAEHWQRIKDVVEHWVERAVIRGRTAAFLAVRRSGRVPQRAELESD